MLHSTVNMDPRNGAANPHILVPMYWMLWAIEKSDDPFGIAYYRNKYGAAPNYAQVPLSFPEDQLCALAKALQIPDTQISKNRACLPGCIFLARKIAG